MKFFGLICFLTFWNFNNGEPALFFDRKENKLVEIIKDDRQAICTSCISLCPTRSNSEEEVLLNDQVSITENGMFVRKFYTEPISFKDMEKDTDICENPYTPALVYDNQLKAYDIGYEFYYEKTPLMKLKSVWYSYYYKVVEGIIANWKKEPNKNLVKMYETGDNTEFQIVATKKIFVFHWINVFTVEILKNQNLRLVTFDADITNAFFHEHTTTNRCEFYYSGDGRRIFDKNSPGNDTKDDVPTSSDKKRSKRKEPVKEGDRLTKTQIIPMQMFHTVAARLSTCIFLNFAFVWDTIANYRLKRIDLYLNELYRDQPSKVEITFGVQGDLQDVYPIARNEITSEDQLFLKFPIPKVILRFVKIFTVDDEIYGAIIVVHNDLKPLKDSDRICKAEDELKDWDDMKNEDSATGYTYVCPWNSKVLKNLRCPEGSDIDRIKPLENSKLPKIDDKKTKGGSSDTKAVYKPPGRRTSM